MIKEKLTVYYNLQESLYSISLNGIEYFFSSEYNLNRFKFRLEQSRNDMKKSFVKKKYPVTTMVEKRFWRFIVANKCYSHKEKRWQQK